MTLKTLKEEFKHMSDEQISVRVDELRREFLTLHLQTATAPIKNFSTKKRMLRRAVACGLTLLNENKRLETK